MPDNQLTEDNPVQQTVAEPLQLLLKQQAASRKQEVRAERTISFRPTRRPPLALLTVLDDGSDKNGEVIRLRTTSFAIGRTKGNLTIAFDPDISARHATLQCRHSQDEYRWWLVDSDSRNGTFLRAFRASPRSGAEFLIGSRRYRMHTEPTPTSPLEEDLEATITYSPADGQELVGQEPQLIEVGAGGAAVHSFELNANEISIGRSTRCGIAIPEDRLLCPKHARMFKDQRSRWVMEDQKSVNGVWIRVSRIALAHQAEFQLGQQRFLFQQR